MIGARAVSVALLIGNVLVSASGACVCALADSTVVSRSAGNCGGSPSRSASLRASCCCEGCGVNPKIGGASFALVVRPELRLDRAPDLLLTMDLAALDEIDPSPVLPGEVRLAPLQERGGILHLCTLRR